MDLFTVALLAGLILAAAALYASVGHAGASGYLAAMALLGVAPAVMKPTALTLNILVATIATFKYYRAGCFSWRLFWPFALASVPCAFIGGVLVLPSAVYRPVVGLVLLYASYRLLYLRQRAEPARAGTLPLWFALTAGAIIGLLSGLTGVGGGIFLSPLLLIPGWADPRRTAGVSAAFILVNSAAGLLGHVAHTVSLPAFLPVLAAAAVIGGWIGAEYGSRRLRTATMQRLLALVLAIAGLKMMLG